MIQKAKERIVQNLQGGKGSVKIYDVLDKEALGSVGRMYAKVILDPGCSVGWHKHTGETEPYYILKGEGTFIDNDGSRTLVHEGDVCTIEDGQFHSMENNSDEPLEIMALIYNLI